MPILWLKFWDLLRLKFFIIFLPSKENMDSFMTPRNRHSIACKRLLRVALEKSGIQQKVAAIDCGIDDSTFSRYLSTHHEHQMPVDMIPAFIASTGDPSVLEYLAEQYGYRLERIA